MDLWVDDIEDHRLFNVLMWRRPTETGSLVELTKTILQWIEIGCSHLRGHMDLHQKPVGSAHCGSFLGVTAPYTGCTWVRAACEREV